jgi:hypothetical protein
VGGIADLRLLCCTEFKESIRPFLPSSFSKFTSRDISPPVGVCSDTGEDAVAMLRFCYYLKALVSKGKKPESWSRS